MCRSSASLTDQQYARLVRELQERDITPNDYDLLLRLDEAVPKRHVLSEEAASRLGEHEFKGHGECAICCSDLEHGELCTELCCGHAYHAKCIRHWYHCTQGP